MAIILTDQELINAKRDIDDIGKAVNQKEVVHPRYGDSFKSLPMIVDEFQISSDAAESAAVSAAESAGIAQSSSQIAQDSAALAELSATAATIGGKVYATPEAGVDPVTGVADGAYFNVRSSGDESYIDEYQNVGGSAVATGKSYPSAQVIMEVQQTVAAVDGKLKRENVSVWDFFTKAEQQAYNLAIVNGTSATYDSHRPLQAFADYVAANDVGTAYCNGLFYTSKGIVFGGSSGCKTKNVIGIFTLYAISGSVITDLLLFQPGDNFNWLGTITADGGGNINFWTRTVQNAVRLGGQYRCVHSYFQSIVAEGGIYEFGVLIDNLTTGTCIDSINATRCGSGLQTADKYFSLYTTFSLISENRVSNSTQYSEISLDTVPKFNLKVRPMLLINDELYHVSTLDTVNKTARIFPLLDNTITTNEAMWVFGAGVATTGGDASVGRINKLTGTANGVVYNSGALYPWVLGSVTTESNFISILLGGGSVSQAHVGGSIASLYTENNVFDIVRRTGAPLNTMIGTSVMATLSKIINLSRYRVTTDNNLISSSALNGIAIQRDGRWLTYEGAPNSNNLAPVLSILDVTSSVRSGVVRHIGDTKTFLLAKPDPILASEYGYNFRQCCVIGTGVRNAPTGEIIFTPPQGYTVNGKETETFKGFTTAAYFNVVLNFNTNNFYVTCLTQDNSIKSSVTYDPPILAAAGTSGDTVATTVTVTGAVVGDLVQAAFNRYNAAIEITASVSATNTVTVKFKNTSASAVDLTSGTITVKLV